MIQRIQTIYLLLVTILCGILLFFPAVEWSSDINAWPLSLISAFISIVACITIFLYKQRPLQIRISLINMLLMVVYYGLFFFYLKSTKQQQSISIHTVAIFPLVSLILSYLAIQAIRKDEAKVRSFDRLR